MAAPAAKAPAAPASPAPPAASDIAGMKVADLRAALSKRGLSYVGRKAELVKRLSAAAAGLADAEQGTGKDEATEAAEDAPAQEHEEAEAHEVETEAAPTPDVSALKVTELKAHLAAAGLPVRGRKADLVARLRQHLDEAATGQVLSPAAVLATHDADEAEKVEEAAAEAEGEEEGSDLSVGSTSVARASSAEYWRQLCPELTVEREGTDAAVAGDGVSTEAAGELRAELLGNGFCRVGQSCEVPLDALPHCAALAEGVRRVVEAGWPASFVLMYDEAWELLRAASALMERASGGLLTCNLDALAWHVDASKGEAGFAPHRDRQPENTDDIFAEDDFPRYATLWVALTDATTQGGCLHAVPKDADPGYSAGDPAIERSSKGLPAALRRALPSKESLQMIAALPVDSGSAVAVSGRTIHWGSAGYGLKVPPRISISFGCSDAGYEAPYLGAGKEAASKQAPPPAALRLALCAGQTIVYHQRFSVDAGILSLCLEVFSRHAEDFEAGYVAKVRAEMMEAVKEAVDNADSQGLGEEVEEALLDKALDGVLASKGDELFAFRDDFDELNDELDGDEESGSEDNDVDEEDEDEEDRALSRRTRSALDELKLMMEDGDDFGEEDEDGEAFLGEEEAEDATRGELSHYRDTNRRVAARVPMWHPTQRRMLYRVGRMGKFLKRARAAHEYLYRLREKAAVFEALFPESVDMEDGEGGRKRKRGSDDK